MTAALLAATLLLQDDAEFFEKNILPVLADKCFSCHSTKAEELKAGLVLDTPEGLRKGGDQGRAVVPGDPEKSLLVRAVRWTDEDLRMPPKKKLSAAEIAAFEAWVAKGAPDPRKKGDSSKGDSKAEDVWAFQPLRKSPVPGGARHPVDAFLLEKLQAKGLKPAPAADKIILLRRVTFDLTGLPPTPAEIDAFLTDATPEAFDRVVDRLLASPHYGEQWARHWLDVVRYADTSGFSNDFERPTAWRYRDYVVRSFNADKPFDRFVLEQLAGDEMEAENPELLVAVGFLRMGPWEHTSMSVAAVTRQQFLDDVTHSTAATFLGLTLRCARCHDHKFDPLPTRDYYRFQAVFAPAQFADRPAPFLPAENTAGFADARTILERRIKEPGYRPVGPTDDPKVKKSLAKVGQKRKQYLQQERQRYEPKAFSVTHGPIQEIFILKGGALESPGDKVGPGAPGAVPVASAIPETAQGRRLALARWIADPGNPLTARVIVNRVWQHHFGGKGIVDTPNNFGKMGKRPTHPELLDWLAAGFLGNGGSLKQLHRLIVTSDAYRRGDAVPDVERLRLADPSNDLLSFYPPRRLAAEEIRDSMLALTGELNRAVGGPGVFPEINMEVALQPRHVMGGPAPAYQPSPLPQDRHRRTIYAFRIRTLEDPMLEVFNRPGSDLSCERRDDTTVAPQAFALFQGQFAHDRALALAHRLERESGDLAGRLDLAFRLAHGRPPTEVERRLCREHVARMTEHHRRHEPVRTEFPTSVRREMVEEFTGTAVMWEEELDLFRNYRRDLKPWDVGAETRALAEVCLVLFNSNEFLYVR